MESRRPACRPGAAAYRRGESPNRRGGKRGQRFCSAATPACLRRDASPAARAQRPARDGAASTRRSERSRSCAPSRVGREARMRRLLSGCWVAFLLGLLVGPASATVVTAPGPACPTAARVAPLAGHHGRGPTHRHEHLRGLAHHTRTHHHAKATPQRAHGAPGVSAQGVVPRAPGPQPLPAAGRTMGNRDPPRARLADAHPPAPSRAPKPWSASSSPSAIRAPPADAASEPSLS